MKVEVTAEELELIKHSLKHYAAKLTSLAWCDLEVEYLEKSDEALTLYKKLDHPFN